MIAMKKITMYLVTEDRNMDAKYIEGLLNGLFYDRIHKSHCILKEEEALNINPKSLKRLHKNHHK